MFPKPPRPVPPPRAVATQVVRQQASRPRDLHVLTVPTVPTAPAAPAPDEVTRQPDGNAQP
ncbi:hypothetical protein [Pseudoduganella chitinolytica]|uniref:Uncharacterized protein n=1 Tax=Pseudoduganella chitinolytica TaxID=34070 RepID=A0ABY8BKW3_9BURK|nr:hypothetical protein [Pseudoduganella chitinolytica]WEF35317.1 hypothetical protein PX653_11350 [Pseudoduganella chitinolytica]